MASYSEPWKKAFAMSSPAYLTDSTSHPTSVSDTEHATRSSEWDRLKLTQEPSRNGFPSLPASMTISSGSSPRSSRALRRSAQAPTHRRLSLGNRNLSAFSLRHAGIRRYRAE